MPCTEGAQIDELRRALRESEQRRQAAEIELADRDRRIGMLTAELARLRRAATATLIKNYAVDFPRLFNSTGAC